MKETLEEAADNWVRKPVIGTRRESFIEGAKWQAERMYSEEDMLGFAEYCLNNVDAFNTPKDGLFTKWFEQFKKK